MPALPGIWGKRRGCSALHSCHPVDDNIERRSTHDCSGDNKESLAVGGDDITIPEDPQIKGCFKQDLGSACLQSGRPELYFHRHELLAICVENLPSITPPSRLDSPGG